MNDNLIEKLRSLDGRSSSSTLRNLMPVIDPLIRRGVSHDDVIATLSESGMKVNVYTFRSALYAYRKKQRSGGIKSEAVEVSTKLAPNTELNTESSPISEDVILNRPVKEQSLTEELRQAAEKYLK